MVSLVKWFTVICIVLGIGLVVSGIKEGSVRRCCIGGLSVTLSTMSYLKTSKF